MKKKNNSVYILTIIDYIALHHALIEFSCISQSDLIQAMYSLIWRHKRFRLEMSSLAYLIHLSNRWCYLLWVGYVRILKITDNYERKVSYSINNRRAALQPQVAKVQDCDHIGLRIKRKNTSQHKPLLLITRFTKAWNLRDERWTEVQRSERRRLCQW